MLTVSLGMLAVIVCLLSHFLLTYVLPITPDLSAWYSGIGLYGLGFVCAIGVFGFVTAVGKQR